MVRNLLRFWEVFIIFAKKTMKTIAFVCKIAKFRGLKRFVCSKKEVYSKLKPIIDNEDLFNFIENKTSGVFGTYGLRVFITSLLSDLYRAKTWLDANSMDDYTFIKKPICEVNIYFNEMEKIICPAPKVAQ